jgi:mitotic-spindle organizing protein 1
MENMEGSKMDKDNNDQTKASRNEQLDILHEIASILNVQIDRESLAVCMGLCENGANPEALAQVYRELQSTKSK